MNYSTNTKSTNTKNLRIQEFDGLRAIAVLLVFLYHFNEDLFFFGWCGVDIFFAISGFVITLQCYVLKQKYSSTTAVKEFFVRRVSRIFPLYYLALLMLLLLPVILGLLNSDENELINKLPKDISDPSVWKNALFLTNFYIYFDGFNSVSYGITWSLAVEQHFYLIFPFVYFFVSGKSLYKSLIIAIISVIIFRTSVAFISETPGRLYFLTFSRADSILFGCLAAHIYLHYNVNRRVILYAFVGIIASLFLALSFKLNEIPQIIFGYSVIPFSIAILMLAIGNHKPFILEKVLANKIMVYIGSVSYGFYLIHIWVVNGCESLGLVDSAVEKMGPLLGSLTMIILEFGITIILSTASFYLFEKPARKAITRLL